MATTIPKLKMLSRVLEEALGATVDCKGATASDAEINLLASRLGKDIIGRYKKGDTDPEALNKAAVESIRSGREVADGA